MATERLIIEVQSRGIRRVNRNLRNLQQQARSTTSVLQQFRNLLVVVASARVIARFAEFVDAFTNIQNRVRLVTNSVEELNAVVQELFDLSQRTRASFEGTATVFNRFARSTLSLGLNFQELLDITEAVNQAVAIGGATAQEARNSLIQFSQGLAAGALRGDELRSVVEQLPELANIIGREFGVAGGQLIAFAKANDGVLETERIIRAIQAAIPDLGERFEQLTPTISQAFEVFNNALIRFLGNLNTSTNFAGRFAEAVIFLAENINTLALSLTALASIFAFNIILDQVLLLGRRLRQLISFFQPLITAVLALARAFFLLRTAIITNPLFLTGAFVVGATVAALIQLEVSIEDVIDALGRLRDVLFLAFDTGRALVRTFVQDFSLLDDALGEIAINAGNRIIDGIESGVNAAIDLLNQIPGIDIEPRNIDRFENQFEGTVERIRNDLVANFGEARGSAEGFVDGAISKLEELQETILGFVTGPQIDRDALLGTPPNDAVTGLDDLSASAKQAGDSLRSLEASVSPFLAAADTLTDAQNTINEAVAAGFELRIAEEELLTRVRREQLGASESAVQAAERQQVLNQALEDTIITLEEFERLSRGARIDFLEDQTGPLAGAERAFLKFTQDATDAAAFTEQVFNDAFNSIEDAVVGFAQTGKFEIDDLFRNIAEQLIRLGTQQAIAGFGNLFQGFLPGGGVAQAGGGPGGLIGNLFGGLLGFQQGGSFQVGANSAIASLPGIDNRLVAFRARDGEEVTVTPRDRPGPMASPINQVFNIQTQDADSFRFSQSQIQARAIAGLDQTRSRRR